MNIMAILAMLVQVGVCAPTQFHRPDGATLTVIVCPMLMPGEAPEAEGDPA